MGNGESRVHLKHGPRGGRRYILCNAGDVASVSLESQLSTQALRSGDTQWKIEMYEAQTSSDPATVFPTRVIIRNDHHPQRAIVAGTNTLEYPGWDQKYFLRIEYASHETLNPFVIKSHDGAYLTVENGKLTWSRTKPAADAMWEAAPAGTAWSPMQVIAVSVGIPVATGVAVCSGFGAGVIAGGTHSLANSTATAAAINSRAIVAGIGAGGLVAWQEGKAIYGVVEPSKENIAQVVVDKMGLMK